MIIIIILPCLLFQVSERLKRMSQTISALLQEVMQRLEVDHGKDLLSTALTLLVCAREGENCYLKEKKKKTTKVSSLFL